MEKNANGKIVYVNVSVKMKINFIEKYLANTKIVIDNILLEQVFINYQQYGLPYENDIKIHVFKMTCSKTV